MFKRRRRHPTPGFGTPSPFNPIQGENANLRQDGTSPFCAMMQVAAADNYDDYVICRGFDTRIVRFVDYAVGDVNKPGIFVAKPFGCRGTRQYRVGEIYPAFLPTQGNTEYSGFKQVTYVPPSPTAVNWRLGQNPGVTEYLSADGIEDGGHPSLLVDHVVLMIDHNGNYVNWMLIHSANEQFYRFQSLADMTTESCAATIRRMDRSRLLYETIHDPDGIFHGMEAGTYGRAFYQRGKYYVINAKCDPDVIDLTDYPAEG